MLQVEVMRERILDAHDARSTVAVSLRHAPSNQWQRRSGYDLTDLNLLNETNFPKLLKDALGRRRGWADAAAASLTGAGDNFCSHR